MKVIVVFFILLPFVSAFSGSPIKRYHVIRSLKFPTRPIYMSLDHDHHQNNYEVLPSNADKSSEFSTNEFELNAESTLISFILPIILCFFPFDSAIANEYGIFAGKTASMIHPITNFAFFGTSLYSAYLGFQWRRLRAIGEDIKALNTELPKLSNGSARFPITENIASINEEILQLKSTADSSNSNVAKIASLQQDLVKLKQATELDSRYNELTATRKSLQGGNLKDKHHITGTVLLGGGITVSILGALNTYMRAGRLFPGPHLYAGMAITILWAVAASLVPYMQKGNEAARNAHIALNIANILLFTSQIPTGIEIMLKVWEKTSWP